MLVILAAITLAATTMYAAPVPVRYIEGVSRGFLRLRGADGANLADGETYQVHRGADLVSRLTFRFHDGSLYDETTVYSQHKQFRLVSEHMVERGPAFPEPIDLAIDAPTGQVTVHYADKGEQKVDTEHLDLPADLANGIVQTLLKNVRPDAPPASFSYVAATPKPRLINLLVSVAGRDRFSVGRLTYRATHYVLKVDVGGVTGAVASLLGKTPPDSHVWIVDGEAPMFLRAEQPFFANGPLWQIDMVAPSWPPAHPPSR